MFSFDRAVKYAARHGISKIVLEQALMSGDLPAGNLPGGGWVIEANELEAWVERN